MTGEDAWLDEDIDDGFEEQGMMGRKVTRVIKMVTRRKDFWWWWKESFNKHPKDQNQTQTRMFTKLGLFKIKKKFGERILE